jgi:hypothetical protein
VLDRLATGDAALASANFNVFDDGLVHRWAVGVQADEPDRHDAPDDKPANQSAPPRQAEIPSGYERDYG